MTRPVILDLFCGAGGAATGYHRAGFDVAHPHHGRRGRMNLLRRRTPAVPTAAPVDVTPQLDDAQRRTYAAEDATRAMQTRLDAAVANARAARVAQVDAEGRAHQLTERVRDLGSEVAALRTLLGRDADRLCTECHDPMPFGTSHHCRRTSTYREDAA